MADLEREVDFASDTDLQYSLMAQPSTNLKQAQELGIKPLSLGDILQQTQPDNLPRMVLFDSSQGTMFPNHWRLLGIDEATKTATLQLCGPFGTYDLSPDSPFQGTPTKGLKPYRVSVDKPFFTGISIQHFETHGIPLTLEQVAIAYREAIAKAEKQERNEAGLVQKILYKIGVEHPSAVSFEHPQGLEHKGEEIYFSNRRGTLRKTKNARL